MLQLLKKMFRLNFHLPHRNTVLVRFKCKTCLVMVKKKNNYVLA